ncbi:MAG TPA: DUF4349 domain-containing protein [Acidimicrobiia bacterium]|nr:DUF4349 domain-containing protein [Acidimicrobiia bacterium]
MKRYLVAGIVGLLLLAACSGSGGQPDVAGGDDLQAGGPAATTTAPSPMAPGGETDEEAGRSPSGFPVTADRQVIYDGQMQLEAADTRGLFETLVTLVESAGGYIAATSIGEVAERDAQPTIFLTVRLPADQLTATLERIRAAADRVATESLQSQDVTDQFVDIEAQLRNLKALETELLALLAELRDNPEADPAKLLQVFDQIRITRGEIEALEGRRQLLENLVALATLQITIVPLPSAAPIVPEDPSWEPGTQARGALRDLVEALQSIGGFLIRFGLYALPILILVAGPIVLIAWLIWRRYRRRRPPVAPPADQPL